MVLPALAFVVLVRTIAPQSENRIETAKSAIEQWAATERVLSKERKDLALAKETLNQRIELLQREIETLRGKIKDTEASIAEADKNRSGMIKENAALKAASDSLGDVLVSLEERTRAVIRRLPTPIAERIKPLSQRLPSEGGGSAQSVAERFQNIVGILNEINKFHHEITVTSEVRAFPDGTSAEVTALYLGIAQGYYTSADEKLGGVGGAWDGEWTWKPIEGSGPLIGRVIRIMKNEEVAQFVHLPVEVK